MFELPDTLKFNRGPVAAPAKYLQTRGCASWLSLTGDGFALVTCRSGPRGSAVAYMYAGLKAGAQPDEVIAAAKRDEAPFVKFEDLKAWVRASIEGLRGDG